MPSPSSPEPLAPALLVEALEPRIAPAALIDPGQVVGVTIGTPQLLKAGQTLSTSTTGGAYLLHVEAGAVLVFTTDLNGNKTPDFNEITGISVSDGVQMTLFTDVHGDIATNLVGVNNGATFELTDSDNDRSNGLDGKVLLNNHIERITLRSLQAGDLDTTVPGETINNRLALSGYSIFGTIYAGGDFGSTGSGGLVINTSGAALQAAKFSGNTGLEYFPNSALTGLNPVIGGIKTGTATNFQHFSFGSSFGPVNGDVSGSFTQFTPGPGAHGGDIIGVRSTNNAAFSVGTLATGDGGTSTGFGGAGARGGNLSEVVLNGDHGGYHILAGNGGQGFSGGVGGSVISFSDLGSVTSEAIVHSGDGGRGSLGLGGAAGSVTFATANVTANLRVLLGNGGDGSTTGGDGAGQSTAVINSPESQTPLGLKVISTTRDSYTFFNALTGLYTTHPQPGDTLVTVTDPGTGQPIALHAYDVGTSRSFDFDNDGFADAIFTSANPDQVVLVFGKAPGTADRGATITSQLNQLQLDSAIGAPDLAFDASKTIFLTSPINPEAVVVGDFNADGRPDVAVASGSASNFGGISVFLNQIGDTLRNPTNVPAFTGNSLGNHPFSDGLQTTVPTLAEFGYLKSPVAIRNLAVGDFNGDGVLDLAYLGVYQFRNTNTVTPQNQLTVLFGDTDSENPYGNGHFFANAALPTDAVPIKVQTGLVTTTVSTALPIVQATAAFNTGAAPTLTATTDSSSPALPPRAGGSVNLGQHDSLFAGVAGVDNQSKFITEYAVNFNPGTVANTTGVSAHQPFTFGLGSDILSAGVSASAGTVGGAINAPTIISLGRVDTNRGADTSLVEVVLLDFSVQDYTRDGRADIVILSDQPTQFITALTGGGDTGTGRPASTSFTLTITSDVGVGTNDAGIKINDTGNTRALRPADDPATFQPNLLAEFVLPLIPDASSAVRTDSFAPPPAAPTAAQNPNFRGLATVGSVGLPTVGNDRTVISFDLVRSSTNPLTPLNSGFEALFPSQGAIGRGAVGFGFVSPVLNSNFNLTANGVEIAAGNGGNGFQGAGGRGGSVGATLAPGAGGPVGSVNITLPAFDDFRGTVVLSGGNGGFGNLGGGAGGDIMGDTVRYSAAAATLTSAVSVRAGDGGASVAGTGGRGGDVAQTVLATARIYFAGNGGTGLSGGRGGNVTGNTQNVPDTATFDVFVTAGNGGLGSMNGGDGGNIANFRPQFLPITGGVGGGLTYIGGTAGNGGGGLGGKGGDVLNSSPDTSVNFLSQSITITAGAGGSGLLGGRGGGVNSFVNSPTTQSAVPTSVTVLGGDGGTGITQRGGTGGVVQNINVTASGLIDTQSATLNLNVLNRAIAGAGGASFAQDGGAGGAVLAVSLTSVSQPVAAASGAGGAGLLTGGAGGALGGSGATNAIVLNAAGTPGRFGKVLAVAGAGGDAAAVALADVIVPGDPFIAGQPVSLARSVLALGGQSGVGGDGGNITNFAQRVGTQVNVDLIAGNGGSIRYGNSLTPTGNVGRGGSVTGVDVTGEIGTSLGETVSAVSPPIASYTVFTTAQPNGVRPANVADLVASALRDTNTRVFSFVDQQTLSNLLANGQAPNVVVGNVGIVAGIAGRVSAVNGTPQPSTGTPNGAVTNVTARNIMSVVAGSVDSVAPVDNVANLRATSGDRIIGADKSPTTPGLPGYNPLGQANSQFEYLDLTGRVVNDLQAGDKLIDGAVFTSANTTGDLLGNRRVFFASQG